MSDYESVKKIQSLQQHIESFTGKSYSDLTSAVQALKNGYGSSEGGGSGIIDVTELPTENIDENAVYRVVTSTEGNIYIRQGGITQPIADFVAAAGLSVCKIYIVDELPAVMEPTIPEVHLYVLKSSGIVWINLNGTYVTTVGNAFLGAKSYDKGYTTDINSEVLDGVYTVAETNSEKWYIREKGEWKIIGYDKQYKVVNLVKPGSLQVFPDDESMLSSVTINTVFKTIGDMIDRTIDSMTAITEECFVKSDGTNVTDVQVSAFAGLWYVETAVIPAFVNTIYPQAFADCSDLKEVTFKGTPTMLGNDLFNSCYKLETINVPWSVDDPINQYAPWGATNATINYNYTGE